ncbi:unnamed protein product [Urochloa decumbens]|uniref:F-box domain-containing protein n=1 Tax=Urochloa decumbens TaxID=240449 RepID=A0ABC9BVM6_9POAL
MPPSSARRHKRRRVGGHRNPSPSPPESRDWAALPSDVLWEVFRRLRTADILCGAGQVCAARRRFSIDERALWRRIDLTAGDGDDAWKNKRQRRKAMARLALERSAGQCEAFSGHDAGRFLRDVAAAAPSLRSLRVRPFRWYRTSARRISRVIAKLPLLEELALSEMVLPNDDLMQALLDHCPRLELLDLGGCVTLSAMASEVRTRLEKAIKHLTLPHIYIYTYF